MNEPRPFSPHAVTHLSDQQPGQGASEEMDAVIARGFDWNYRSRFLATMLPALVVLGALLSLALRDLHRSRSEVVLVAGGIMLLTMITGLTPALVLPRRWFVPVCPSCGASLLELKGSTWTRRTMFGVRTSCYVCGLSGSDSEE